MKYCLVPLGCQMNKADAERIDTVLSDMGYQKTDVEDQADLLGVVACSVRQKAIDRAYTKIHKWNQMKDQRNVVTFISGCILPADEKKFLKSFDIVFKIDDLPKLPDMILQYGVVTPGGIQRNRRGIRNDFDVDYWSVPASYTSDFQAYVPIQNGCDKLCTFCAVPYTRGREKSRPSDEIIDEVAQLIKRGYKSITLLGQNVNSYGLDKNGEEMTFPALLERIGQLGDSLGKPCWVYFTSPHPRDMSEAVLETMSRYDCLAKQVHLPIQSGDNGVLKRMNRRYTVESYGEIVASIRKILPTATLFTDIIVGFCGETASEFESTRRAMANFQYNMAYIAQYSPRPGAQSDRWADTVPHIEKKKRFHALSQILEKTARGYNEQMVGKVLRVLVEGPDRKTGYLSGKTEGRITVRFPCDGDQFETTIGQFVDVFVTSATPYGMEGIIEQTS